MRILLTIHAHVSAAQYKQPRKKSGKQQSIVLLCVSFGATQHGVFYSCGNDVPNDAPNVSRMKPVADVSIDQY